MYLVRSGAVEGFEKLSNSLGANAVTLMSDVGLSPAQFRNPNTYISYSKLAELLEVGAIACEEPLFGLLLASRQSASVLGDLSMIMSQQPTVGDALKDINQYLYLHARGVHLNQQAKGDVVELELIFDFLSPRGLDQLIQMSMGQLAHFIADLLHIDSTRLAINLRQDKPITQTLKQQTYKRVSFCSQRDMIEIPISYLAKKTRSDEAIVKQHFEQYLQQLTQRYPNNLQDQIKEIIGWMLPSGECCIDRIAGTLDVHPRVLQKRLQKQGSSYAALLKEARQVIAEQHLQHASLSITDLALHLGYAEVSIFSRNFKKWTGLSPRQWQQERQAE